MVSTIRPGSRPSVLASLLSIAFPPFPHAHQTGSRPIQYDNEQWACLCPTHNEHGDCFAQTTTWWPAVKREQTEWGQLLQQSERHWRTMRQLERVRDFRNIGHHLATEWHWPAVSARNSLCKGLNIAASSVGMTSHYEAQRQPSRNESRFQFPDQLDACGLQNQRLFSPSMQAASNVQSQSAQTFLAEERYQDCRQRV